MNANTAYPQGLTRVIFETLVALTPEVVANGESWSPQLLGEVEHDVRQQLAPRGSVRDSLIFDMVFRRAFAEARNLLLQTSSPSAPATTYQRPAVQAIA